MSLGKPFAGLLLISLAAICDGISEAVAGTPASHDGRNIPTLVRRPGRPDRWVLVSTEGTVRRLAGLGDARSDGAAGPRAGPTGAPAVSFVVKP